MIFEILCLSWKCLQNSNVYFVLGTELSSNPNQKLPGCTVHFDWLNVWKASASVLSKNWKSVKMAKSLSFTLAKYHITIFPTYLSSNLQGNSNLMTHKIGEQKKLISRVGPHLQPTEKNISRNKMYFFKDR